MRTVRGNGWWVPVVVCAALATPGCAPQQGGEEPVVLETEEIGLEDEELDLSGDRKGKPPSRSAGQLPGGFPEDLPIYKPSTIADMGQGEGGDFVQFMSQDKADTVRAWYPGALAGAGWSVERGPEDVLIASRGQRRARISIEASGPVALIRVDF